MWQRRISLTFTIILLIISNCNTLYVSELYPYGISNGDKTLPTSNQEDISSQEIKLNTSIRFFDRDYDSIFVSTKSKPKFHQISDRGR